MQVRVVTVPIYATNIPSQVEYLINNADIKILFVGEQAQMDCAIQIANNCTQLIKIVVIKSSINLHNHPLACHWENFIQVEKNMTVLETRLASKRLDDLFTLI